MLTCSRHRMGEEDAGRVGEVRGETGADRLETGVGAGKSQVYSL